MFLVETGSRVKLHPERGLIVLLAAEFHKGNRQLSNLDVTCRAMEAIYLNSFRIALPVAFPATRRPTGLPTLPFLTAL